MKEYKIDTWRVSHFLISGPVAYILKYDKKVDIDSLKMYLQMTYPHLKVFDVYKFFIDVESFKSVKKILPTTLFDSEDEAAWIFNHKERECIFSTELRSTYVTSIRDRYAVVLVENININWPHGGKNKSPWRIGFGH